jgi:hypothetical protein
MAYEQVWRAFERKLAERRGRFGEGQAALAQRCDALGGRHDVVVRWLIDVVLVSVNEDRERFFGGPVRMRVRAVAVVNARVVVRVRVVVGVRVVMRMRIRVAVVECVVFVDVEDERHAQAR